MITMHLKERRGDPFTVRLSWMTFFLLVLLWPNTSYGQLTPTTIAQQELVQLGYNIGTVDGLWGPRSTAAMLDYQSKSDLPQTGLPDIETLAHFAQPNVSERTPVDGPEVKVADTPSVETRPLVAVDPKSVVSAPEPAKSAKNLAKPLAQAASPSIPPKKTLATAGFLMLAGLIALPSFCFYAYLKRRKRKARATAVSAASPPFAMSVAPHVSIAPTGQTAAMKPQNALADAGDHAVDRAVLQTALDAAFGAVVIPVVVQDPQYPTHDAAPARAQADAHNDAVHENVRQRAEEARRHGIMVAAVDLPPKIMQAAPATIPTPAVSGETPSAVSRFRLPLSSPAPKKEQSTWVRAHDSVAVGKHHLTRGLVYVGEKLPTQQGWPHRDNCLIVPSPP